jgi:hypothetical protein
VGFIFDELVPADEEEIDDAEGEGERGDDENGAQGEG